MATRPHFERHLGVKAAYLNAERTGSVLADSGADNLDGTLQKAGTWETIAGHGERYSITLDGTQYALRTTTTGGLIYGANLAVSAWVAPSSYSTRMSVCGNRIGNTSGFYVALDSAGTIEVAAFGGSTQTIAIPGSPVANAWHHIAVRFLSGSLTVWWDGVLVRTASVALVPALGADAPMALWAKEVGSADATVNQPFVGKGADLCFWTTLSNDEIAWLADPANSLLAEPADDTGNYWLGVRRGLLMGGHQ